MIAIQNARLYQDLANERDRIIEVQEEARKKLARDLHDGPTQSVAAIAMRVNMAQRTMVKDPKAAYEELSCIEELARRTTKEIRHMLFTLRPLVLESQGLVSALQAMADKMKETYSQNVFVNVDEGLLGQLEMGRQGVILLHRGRGGQQYPQTCQSGPHRGAPAPPRRGLSPVRNPG